MIRTVIPALALTAASICTALPAFADVAGLWRTEPGETGSYLLVEVAPCAADAAKTCGIIAAAKSSDGGDIRPEWIGRAIISDMVPDGPDAWTDGEIWAPDEDKSYASNMELRGDVLSVEGCVLVFCRGQDWTRADAD